MARSVLWRLILGIAVVSGCGHPDPAVDRSPYPTTLTIGYGLTAQTGIAQAADLITQEGLVNLTSDGRPVAWLAQSWNSSPDGLSWRFVLRPDVKFHDGTTLTAQVVRNALIQQLPATLGPSFANIREIRAVSDNELEFVLKKRSTLLVEALNVLIHTPDSNAGTGAFYAAGQLDKSTVLLANPGYYAGKPAIDRILIQPYTSVRAAWADMLRGRVDMLYEVGPDALDFMQPATATRLFTFQRPYAYVIVLNVHKPALKDASVRRALNAAINRNELITTGMAGHGRVADSPLWPQHWANDRNLPHFSYEPAPLRPQPQRLTLTCLYSDRVLERIALTVQQQLSAVGVNMNLEFVSVPEGMKRTANGEFDAWLVDMGLGPNFFRQYFFWHSGSPFNLGRYSTDQTDAALDAVQAARDENEYRRGVADFLKAMVNDPPAIFLAWSERSRAVNTRFELPQEPGRDILSTLRLWRPVTARGAGHN